MLTCVWPDSSNIQLHQVPQVLVLWDRKKNVFLPTFGKRGVTPEASSLPRNHDPVPESQPIAVWSKARLIELSIHCEENAISLFWEVTKKMYMYISMQLSVTNTRTKSGIAKPFQWQSTFSLVLCHYFTCQAYYAVLSVGAQAKLHQLKRRRKTMLLKLQSSSIKTVHWLLISASLHFQN